MTSRERVLKTINGQVPDRPPVVATLTPQIGDMLNEYLGIFDDPLLDSFFANRVSYTKALTKLGNDCVVVGIGLPDGYSNKVDDAGRIIDEWGITWATTGTYYEMVNHPLSEIESVNELDNYNLPEPLAKGRFDMVKSQIRDYGKDYGIIAEQECTILELSWYLVGLEKFLMDIMLEKAYVYELMDRVMEINLKQICQMVELGVDIVWTGDDIGNQNGMMISPELWRKVFKPRMQHVFATIKKLNPDIRIAYHSCGSVRPVIPDLIEIGLDLLNPLQPRAKGMDAAFLKDNFGEELMFFGGIDIQDVLPNGSPEEVREHVFEKQRILGKNGGFILAPAHNIQPDTPLENVLAFFEAATKY